MPARDRETTTLAEWELSIATDPATIADEWRSFEQGAIGHVFQTFDFVGLWLATVGIERGVAPRIVLGQDASGELLFLLPLGVRTCLSTRIVQWLGGEHADFHAGLFAPDFLARLAALPDRAAQLVNDVAALFKGEADMVGLQHQPALIGGFPNPFAAYLPILNSDGSHLTRLGSDWQTYYRSKRNASSRRNDRAKRLNLEAAGGFRILDATTPAEIERVMSALFAQKARGLAKRGVPDLFASPAVRDFYMQLALKPYPQGLTHVAALECAGEIAATSWGLVRGNHYYYVMHAFSDGPLARWSPGRHLMYYLMQWAIDHGLEFFDFTIGDVEFKSHWCEERAPLYDSVAALNPRGLPMSATVRLGKAVKRRIKNSPVLLSSLNAIRRRTAAILE